MRKRKQVFLLFCAVAILAGCATINLDEERAGLWMLNIYNSEYDAYVEAAKNPDALTDKQKEIMRVKKRVLMEMDPLLDIYIGYLKTGAVPVDKSIKSIELRLIDLVNALTEG